MNRIFFLLSFFLICSRICWALDNQDAVLNLVSNSHTVNVPSGLSQISFSWSPPSGTTEWDGYVFKLDQNDQLDFEFNETNIEQNPMDVYSWIFSCSGDYINYYFHIAPAVYDFENFQYVFGKTINSGPFRVDTVAPYNQIIYAPELTNDTIVQLKTGAIGATKMCISSVGFGKSCTWQTLETLSEYHLSEGDGKKTIFIQYKDDAENIANTETSLTLDTSPPRIQLISDPDGAGLTTVSFKIFFSEEVTGFEISDIYAREGRIVRFSTDNEVFIRQLDIEIDTSEKILNDIVIPENAVFDKAGNGNVAFRYKFFNTVPTLNEWGQVLFSCLLLAYVLFTYQKKAVN